MQPIRFSTVLRRTEIPHKSRSRISTALPVRDSRLHNFIVVLSADHSFRASCFQHDHHKMHESHQGMSADVHPLAHVPFGTAVPSETTTVSTPSSSVVAAECSPIWRIPPGIAPGASGSPFLGALRNRGLTRQATVSYSALHRRALPVTSLHLTKRSVHSSTPLASKPHKTATVIELEHRSKDGGAFESVLALVIRSTHMARESL